MNDRPIARSFQAGGHLRELMERTRLTRPETRFDEPGTVEVSATVSPGTLMRLAALLAAAYAPALAPAIVRKGEPFASPGDADQRG